MRRLLALAFCCLSLSAQAKPVAEPVTWKHGGTDFDGFLVYDNASKQARPGLLLVPNWMGVTDAAVEKAKTIAGDDYVILLVDMYGRGVRPTNPAEAGKAAKAVFADTEALRGRIRSAHAVLEVMAAKSPLDAGRIGGIGFCFGGAVILELARSGAAIDGVVSFHGDLQTRQPAESGVIKAPVLVLNGAEDGFVPAEQVTGFQSEMRAAGADWQVVNFGGAMHCFAEPDADGVAIPGCKYHEPSARRGFEMMRDFFAERFAD